MIEAEEKDYKISKNNYGEYILIISEGVEEIPANMFKGMVFNKIKFPSSLKKIGDSAFAACRDLKEIEIPDSVEYIGPNCFYSCNKLSKIKLSNNIKTIFHNTFAYCALSEIDIPNSVEVIGEFAFYNASKETLLKVKLPSSVRVVGRTAFELIPNVEIYTSAGNNTFFANKGKNIEFIGEHIDVPESKVASYHNSGSYTYTDDRTLIINPGIELVEKFDINFFRSSMAINKVVFPDSVKYIADDAFASLSIKEFNIPSNLVYVGQRVFQLCSKIENNKVILPNSTLLVGSEAFFKAIEVNIPENCCYRDDTFASPTFTKRKTNGTTSLIDVIDAQKERLKELGYDCDKVNDNINSIVKKDKNKIKLLEDMLVYGLVTGAIDDDSIEIFAEFLKCGVSPYTIIRADNFKADATKFSIMEYLIIKNFTKLIIQLFYYGYSASDINEKTKLMIYATKMDNSDLLELFIALNFPINCMNEKGNTPLIIASKYGKYHNAKLLIDSNASIVNRNIEGDSAIDIARKNNNHEIVKLLDYEMNLINQNEFNEEDSQVSADIDALTKLLSMEKS